MEYIRECRPSRHASQEHAPIPHGGPTVHDRGRRQTPLPFGLPDWSKRIQVGRIWRTGSLTTSCALPAGQLLLLLCKNDQFPANASVSGRVLMMVLRRKGCSLVCGYLVTTSLAPVYSGIGNRRPRRVKLVEFIVIGFRQITCILILSHFLSPSLITTPAVSNRTTVSCPKMRRLAGYQD